MKYHLAHVGINCENEAEAKRAAVLFEAMFGLTAKNGDQSVFAGTEVECMKAPGAGKNGHIAIGTPDVAAAVRELEEKGFYFNRNTAKYKPDGTLRVIYLDKEICGFAIHLTESK